MTEKIESLEADETKKGELAEQIKDLENLKVVLSVDDNLAKELFIPKE